MNKKQKTLLWRIIIAAIFWVPLFLISEDIVHAELPKWALIILFLFFRSSQAAVVFRSGLGR